MAGLDFGQSASGVVTQRPLDVPNAAMPSYETIILSVHDSDRFDCVPEPDVYQDRTLRNARTFRSTRKMIDEQHIVYAGPIGSDE